MTIPFNNLLKKVFLVLLATAGFWISPNLLAASEIRIELPVVPELSRYSELLEYPGYFAIALETNGLSPSMSSRLEVSELGKVLKVRNGEIRFIEKKGSLYKYEASVILSMGSSGLVVPVVVSPFFL